MRKNFKNSTIIFNPVSGKGNSKENRLLIKSLVKKYGWQGEFKETTKQRGAGVIAAQAVKNKAKHIIVCGGDGTIKEAIESILHTQTTMAAVPLGTGNLFVKNLNIPEEIEDAVKTAFMGRIKKIDIGKVNDNYFSIMAGIGFDARIMQKTKRSSKNRFGMLAYLASMLKSLDMRRKSYEISFNKKSPIKIKAQGILIANMSKIQAGINAVPTANPENKKLKLGIIKARDLGSWIEVGINALKGNINKSSYYKLLEGKEFTIKILEKPEPYQCDGEDFAPTKNFKVEIYPSTLSVVVPNK